MKRYLEIESGSGSGGESEIEDAEFIKILEMM